MSKTVFKNTFHYGAVQLLSYGIPLLLVPYISRTVGIERYGITEFSLEIALFFGAIVWNILHPPLEAFMHDYSAVQWWWILYIGVMGTLVPFGLYLEGINLIRSTRASITATLEPITAGIISYIFLNEIMEAWQITGGILVIASIILLQLHQEQDDKAPSVIRARRQNQ